MKINGINTQLKNDYKLDLLTNGIIDYNKIIPQSQRNNFQQQRTRNVYTKKHTKKYQFRSVNNSFNLEDEGGVDIELDAVSKIVPIDSDICMDSQPRKIKRTNSCETTKVKHFEDFEIYNDNFTNDFMTKRQDEEHLDNAEKIKEIQNQLSLLKRENTKLQTQNMEYKTKLYRTKKNTYDYKPDKGTSNIERKYKRENEELKQKVKKLEDEVKMLNELLNKNKKNKNENKLKYLHVTKGDRFNIIPKKKIQKHNSFNIKKNSSLSQKNIHSSKYTSYNSTMHNKIRISNNFTALDGDEIKETKQKTELNQYEEEVIQTEKSIKEKKPLRKKRSLPDKFETQPNKEDIQNLYYSPTVREESLQININDYNDDFFEDFPLSPPKIQENFHITHSIPLPIKSIDDKQALHREVIPKEEEKKIQPQTKPQKEKASLIMSVLNDDFCGSLLCQNNLISTQNESDTQRSKQRNNSVEKFLTNNSNLPKKEKGSKISKYIKRK